MNHVLVRLAGFTLLPLLTLITPLLMLPIVSNIVGSEGWSSAVSGIAIGTFGATIIMWGWNVDGPVRVARAASPNLISEIYRESLQTRLLLGAFTMPVIAVCAVLVASEGHRVEAVLLSFTTAIAGFSPAWVGIGLGRPMLLAIYDTLPRFVGTALALPLLLMTEQLWLYPTMLVVTTVLGLWLFQSRHAAVIDTGTGRPHNTMSLIRKQGKTALISLSGAAYASSPTPVATSTNPGSVTAGFASADTIYRLGIFSIVALGNAFQGWTLEKGSHNKLRRHVQAIVSHSILGILGLAGFVLLGPFVTSVLYGESRSADVATCAFFGVAFLFLSAATPLIRNILIPAGKQKIVLQWTLASAVVGLLFMIVAGSSGYVPGVSLGMALSEAILFTGLIVPALASINDKVSGITDDGDPA